MIKARVATWSSQCHNALLPLSPSGHPSLLLCLQRGELTVSPAGLGRLWAAWICENQTFCPRPQPCPGGLHRLALWSPPRADVSVTGSERRWEAHEATLGGVPRDPPPAICLQLPLSLQRGLCPHTQKTAAEPHSSSALQTQVRAPPLPFVGTGGPARDLPLPRCKGAGKDCLIPDMRPL